MNERASQQTFSTRMAARILAVSPGRIRYWVKSRLVQPASLGGRKYQFGFNDLLLMRLTKELLPSRRRLEPVKRAFEKLGRLLDSERPLTSLKVADEDGRIVVRDGRVTFEPDSGQLLLDFEARREAAKPRVNAVSLAALKDKELTSTAEGFEETDPLHALELYREVLEADPQNVAAHLRMGSLYDRVGDRVRALRHLLAAATQEPNNALVHLALGIVYRKEEQSERALRSFLRAVQCDNDLVDAHRHLAELYETLGRRREVIRHLSAVHRLTRKE